MFIDYDLSEVVYKKLLPFQIEGVKQALNKNGRLLLADEMGLGKTYQALAIAHYYRIEWPLLIIAPASLLENWRNSIRDFLGLESVVVRKKEQIDIMNNIEIDYINNEKIHKLNECNKGTNSKVNDADENDIDDDHYCGNKNCSFNSNNTSKSIKKNNILIMSYDIASKYHIELKNNKHKVIILDECHYIKNHTAKRTTNLMPILQYSNRLILLSGTPALSRPVELYTMLTALNKNLFTNMTEYGMRYCNLRKIGHFYDWKGCSNHEELYHFLKKCIMIRRTKDEVLGQLPAKFRRQVVLKVAQEKKVKVEKEEIKKMIKLNDEQKKETESCEEFITIKDSVDELITNRYKIAAELKQDAVKEYIQNMLEKNCKFIIFAHHMTMINSLEEFLKTKTKYIKIDGKTPGVQRQALIDKYQNNEEIKVALLGLTACSAGLTLTAAKAVIFAELYWNPGTLLQAEDRVHRIGQKNTVDIHYLTAIGTVDEYVWPNLLKKLNTLEKLGIGKNDYKGIENISSNQKSIEQYIKKK